MPATGSIRPDRGLFTDLIRPASGNRWRRLGTATDPVDEKTDRRAWANRTVPGWFGARTPHPRSNRATPRVRAGRDRPSADAENLAA